MVLATGGYGNVFYLSTNARGCNVTASWRAHRRGALFANPCFTQIHPTCIPVSGDYQSKLTLMSESLRNDGRVWVPVKAGDTAGTRRAFPRRSATTTWSGSTRASATWRRATSRAARRRKCATRGGAWVPAAAGCTSTSPTSIQRLGEATIAERYGNLFDMYQRITDENPYQAPMRIYPAVHYTMGGLWVDYNLMSTVPGLHVLGEANFSDHGANRLGASALMQGLADGYFVIPLTIGDYLATAKLAPVGTDHPEFRRVEAEVTGRIGTLLGSKGRRTADSFHRELGKIMWEKCGMARTASGLKEALARIPELRAEFWSDVQVPGNGERAEPVAGAGGPGGRLPRAGRADVPRRAGARGVVRRTLPGGAPDGGWRGEAG